MEILFSLKCMLTEIWRNDTMFWVKLAGWSFSERLSTYPCSRNGGVLSGSDSSGSTLTGMTFAFHLSLSGCDFCGHVDGATYHIVVQRCRGYWLPVEWVITEIS